MSLKSLGRFGRLFTVNLFWLFFYGCSNVEQDSLYIHQMFEDKLVFKKIPHLAPSGFERLLWKTDEFALYGRNFTFKNQNLYVVRYPLDARSYPNFNDTLKEALHKTLELEKSNPSSSPSVWLRYEPQNNSTGYALLAVHSDLELAGLAAMAHKGAFPACGAIEAVNLSLTRVDDPPLGPVFSELVAINEVSGLFKQTKVDQIKSTIAELEGLGTRFHASTSGLNVPAKIEEMWQNVSSNLGQLTISQQTTQKSAQKSVIATLAGQKEDQEVVILGAHLDSINGAGFSEPAPGADDDASGVATLREILRIIFQNNLKFRRRLEFHAYGAEEVGLLGSSTLAQNYAALGKKVVGMMQFDMNAWSQTPGKTVYLIKNDTNNSLRKGVRDLMHTYFQGDYVEANLTAGTSDHKSWTLAGYPAVFPFENPGAYNKALHTLKDTSANLNNLELSERMVHLGLAFISHYAGLITGEGAAQVGSKEVQSQLSRDIKLAFAQKEGFDPQNAELTVAVPTTVKSVEVCPVTKAGGLECSGERRALVPSVLRGSRQFFSLAAAPKWTAGERWSFFGLSDKGQVTHQRTVRIDLKASLR